MTPPTTSDRKARAELKRRVDETDALRRRAKDEGLEFSAPSLELLEHKLGPETVESPLIDAMSWTSGTAPGSPASFRVHMSNPDALTYYPMFVTIFFGVANFFDDVADGIVGRDQRWPYLTSQPFELEVDGTAEVGFDYTTPTTVPSST